MTSKKTLATSLASLSTGLMLALFAAGGATAAPATSQDSAQPTVTSTAVSTSATDHYWTPERMRAAVPGEVLADKAVARQINAGPSAAPEIAETGSSTKIAGTSPTVTLQALHTDVAPVNHVGKVFFTMAGANYVCSGNSVIAENKSTVSTAGHCVNEGPGAYVTNFAFVPAYNNGTRPYGTWTARTLVTTSEWANNGDITYDGGFAVMNTLGGQTLTTAVGGQGIAFNQPRGLTYNAYGYPAAGKFNGQTLQSCSGTATPDPYGQTQSQGIPCDMTGGSSGGPWLISNNTVLNSVNSFGYQGVRNTMFGPYFGADIQSAYTTAAGL
jgi:V8-like Glu-specific endopeptidase